ncbi:DUF2807 domain-containing protein [Sphingomonas sp. ST-64]|uniref:DUF2807 domain-containing protein n=1 Tax=Sphingomonas plantiphila TaxID=3163295 RepID=A0ABW8YME6_9SPHN
MRLFLLPLLALATVAAQSPATERRTVMITAFERMRVDGPFVVKVTSGGPPGAVIAADRRAAQQIGIRNIGGQLVIGARDAGFEGWNASDGPATILVSARDLRAVTINGGGRVEVDRLRGQRVDLGVNGAGTLTIGTLDADQLAVTLTGTGAIALNGGLARTARFNTHGAGSIDAVGLSVNDLTVNSQSAGDSRFTARYTAAVSTLGTGAVRVLGNAACRLAGPGPAQCAGKTERRR